MANQAMVELWNGPASEAWVSAPERYDGMLHELGLLVLDAARLQPGDRVLDVGCGSGQLSRDAAARVGPTGAVLGVDVSARLVALAEQRTAGAPVRHLVADAQVDDLPDAPFDVVVSRFGVMFFDDPTAAFAHLRDATTPGGRLAFAAWQGPLDNEWMLVPIGAIVPIVGPPDLPPPDAPGPFSFAEPARIRTVLEGAGWADVDVQPVETTVLVGGGGDVEQFVTYVEQDLLGQMLLRSADAQTRAAALAALREAVAPRMTEEGLRLGAKVWLVTARRD
jgi:SAM-dependent methyltransferase